MKLIKGQVFHDKKRDVYIKFISKKDGWYKSVLMKDYYEDNKDWKYSLMIECHCKNDKEWFERNNLND